MTIQKRIMDLRRRHIGWVAVVLAVVVGVGFIMGQAIEGIEESFIDSGAINLLVFLLVLDLSYALGDIARSRSSAPVQVSKDQAEAMPQLWTEAAAMSSEDADLLEYSAVTVDSIITQLRENECRMRILVKHPDSVASVFQRDRILQEIRTLLVLVLADYQENAEVRCYRAAASVRGRRLGNRLINIGWYTPSLKELGLEVHGHSNPMITAPSNTPEGRDLLRMFNGLFESLWEAPDTEDARAVI